MDIVYVCGYMRGKREKCKRDPRDVLSCLPPNGKISALERRYAPRQRRPADRHGDERLIMAVMYLRYFSRIILYSPSPSPFLPSRYHLIGRSVRLSSHYSVYVWYPTR